MHLIYHTERDRGSPRRREARVGNFIRIEKRFANKKPTLQVDDLGDANALLQNSSHFQNEADLLLRRGVHEIQPVLGRMAGAVPNEVAN